jgi:hypothetical protein
MQLVSDGMQYIDQLVVIIVSALFGIFLIITFQKMKHEFNSFTWNSYYKHCDIYQGKSHWNTIKNYSYIILNQLKRKTS